MSSSFVVSGISRAALERLGHSQDFRWRKFECKISYLWGSVLAEQMGIGGRCLVSNIEGGQGQKAIRRRPIGGPSGLLPL